MKIDVSLIEKLTHPDFRNATRKSSWNERDPRTLDLMALSPAAIEQLEQVLRAFEPAPNDQAQHRRSLRVLEAAIESIRSKDGNVRIPSFDAAATVIAQHLSKDLIDAWIYVEYPDGRLYPELVTRIEQQHDDKRTGGTPQLIIQTIAVTHQPSSRSKNQVGAERNSHKLEPNDVVRKSPSEALRAIGLHHETEDLKKKYLSRIERHEHHTNQDQFAKQFRLDGRVFPRIWRRSESEHLQRRVIHDLVDGTRTLDECGSHDYEIGSVHGVGKIPLHPFVRVFDLKTHEFHVVAGDDLTLYEYDESLRDKLVLPATHRDMLNVLTSDFSLFTGDIIEGKTAGNVILCKGQPGVGKTLTAEVYAELTKRPLYAIHSGSLGTGASQIHDNLQVIFERAERWGCVLLLDEADVFVIRRGDSLIQNAVVAEFLRVLEYFDGLMFLTTNRSDDIDEAIISRCAAIIRYEVPDADDAAKIWRVMAKQFDSPLCKAFAADDNLIAALHRLFPTIAPRDIKMLLRLVLRVAQSKNEPITIDHFRRCAMFRDIAMEKAEMPAG